VTKTEARLNQRNLRKIRDRAERLVVVYAPYIIKMSRTPEKRNKKVKSENLYQPRTRNITLATQKLLHSWKTFNKQNRVRN
jgi:hypothetical protein